MNRLINIIGIIVLLGILLKLSYVFVYLFSELDDNSLMSKITGVTFAFASVWFVVKVNARWLKLTVIFLDVCTILYFYLHELLSVQIEYAAIIIAAYSGLIVYYIGNIVNEQLKSVTDTETVRLRNELNRLRTVNEVRELETEIARTRRRIADSRNSETRDRHTERLNELEENRKKLTKIYEAH